VEDEGRTKIASPFPEESSSLPPSAVEALAQPSESRSPLGAIGNDAPAGKTKDDKEARASDPQDPLAGMSEADKWGFKGLRTLMNNYPDYNALMTGIDPSTLGLDLNSTE
jgi:CCR4-NOT transcription complex subunit 2